MAELKVYLSSDLSQKFRRIAMTVYGYGRGSLSKAAEEAFAKWCLEHDLSPTSVNPDPPDAGTSVTKSTRSHIDPDERKSREQESKVRRRPTVNVKVRTYLLASER